MASYTGPPSRVSLHVTFHIDPSNVPAFLKALKPAYDAVIAEPECVFFEVYQSPTTPGQIKFIENWDASVEWLMNVRIVPYLPPPRGREKGEADGRYRSRLRRSTTMSTLIRRHRCG
jgi:hypothetical protein